MDNNGQYLIPANTKKGQLIASIFLPIDLGIFVTGVALTFGLLVILANVKVEAWVNLIAVIPAGIATVLVFPFNYYHNVRVAIGEIINFYSNNRNYVWRGWCIKYESREK